MAGKATKIVGGLAAAAAIAAGIWYFLRPPAPPPGKATLYGIVTDADTGDPIGGVDVYIDGAITSTDPTGYYELAGIEPGTREVVFEKEGYDPGSTTVELAADETRELNFQMTPTGVPDAEVSLRWD